MDDYGRFGEHLHSHGGSEMKQLFLMLADDYEVAEGDVKTYIRNFVRIAFGETGIERLK